MVKIRLHGLLEDVERMIKEIKLVFDVVSVSRLYKDRGDSKLYRVYIEIKN